MIQKLKRGLKKIAKHRHLPKDIKYEYEYYKELKKLSTNIREKKSEGAVLLHLYYPEMWPYFSEQLKFLVKEKKLDLFVTIQKKNAFASKDIQKDYPSSYVVELPNKGRDVLPFLYISRLLQQLRYKYILKIHSKKSPQREDGQEWAKQIFKDLIIKDEKKFNAFEKILRNKNTALVGPVGNYVPLPTYYNDNHPTILALISRIKGESVARKFDEEKWNYGFFAGTMFWVKLEAIRPILDQKIKVRHFVPEKAQLDGTIAHALERVLCAVPELENRDIYEIKDGVAKKIPYQTDFTPVWSDHYQGE